MPELSCVFADFIYPEKLFWIKPMSQFGAFREIAGNTKSSASGRPTTTAF
jgi:hypothetical protein